MYSRTLCRLYAGREEYGLEVGDLLGELKQSGQFEIWAFGNPEIELAAVRLAFLPDDLPLFQENQVYWGTLGDLRQKMAGFAATYPKAVALTSKNGHFPGADDDLKDGLFPLTREATGGLITYKRLADADGVLTNRWQIIGMTTESGIWHPCRDWNKEYNLVCEPETLATIIQQERSRVTVHRDESDQITEIGTEVDVTNGRDAYWARMKTMELMFRR